MASEETTGLKVEKLDGENYHNWKFQMKLHLMAKNLWEIVTGDETLSEDATAAEKIRFKRRENLALATVCLSVVTGLQIYVRSAATAKEAWESLQQHFEKKSLSQKIFYRRKLYAAQMDKGGSMLDHVNYIKTLSEHLEAVGDSIAEKDLVIILVSSLPESYNYLITALETIAEERLTWDYVRDRLIHEHEKMQGGSMERKTSEALFTKGSSYKGSRNAKKGVCFYCHKEGHYAKNCFKKKADQRKAGSKSSEESANRAEADIDSNPEMETNEMHGLALTAHVGQSKHGDDWWIDSGATQHMTPDRNGMHNFVKFNTPKKVQLADNSVLFSYGKGDLRLVVYDGCTKVDLKLSNVLYVPKIKKKLLSLPTITEKGAEVRFKDQSFTVIMNEEMYCIGHKSGKMFKLNVEPIHKAYSCSVNQSDDINLWHNRLGHLGYDNVKLLYNESMVDGLKLNSKQEIDQACDGCAMGKLNRLPFPKKSGHKTEHLLEIIHSDVCGPMNVQSIGGSRYFITFIDDWSRYTKVYMMKNKGEALDKFKEFVNLAENLTGQRVKVLRSDNGGEYGSKEFIEFCKSRGIKKEATTPYTPQQNGVAERMNRTIIESVRSMLHKAGLPLTFWAEAVATAVLLRNRSPTSHIKNATPFERYHSRKPDVSALKVFGCIAYVHVPKEKRKKLDKKSTKCIFIGYPEDRKAYKFYNPATKKMSISRDALFLEKTFHEGWSEDVAKVQNKRLLDEESEVISDVYLNDEELEADNQDVQDEHPTEAEDVNNQPEDEHPMEAEVVRNQPEVIPRRSTRRVAEPNRLGIIAGNWWEEAECEFASYSCVDDVMGMPKTIEEALDSPHRSDWKEALDSEYKSLVDHQTWNLVEPPKGQNIVDSKWVFKVKYNAEGSVERFKTRLVAKGFTQKAGIDYEETFSPVVRYTSIRTLLAVVNQLDLDLHQMDVSTAFLNGTLSEDIYMSQPEGYIQEGNESLVCKLNKSIYGLKQASRCWYDTLDQYLKKSGYKQCKADSCIYLKRVGTQYTYIAVYVDDLLIASNDNNMLNKEKKSLQSRFNTKDLGEAHYCLGIQIQRDREKKKLLLHQQDI
eukprot:gene2050-biopygen1853